MAALEEILCGAVLNGVVPDKSVTVTQKLRLGANRLKVWYTDADGGDGCLTLDRACEPDIDIVVDGQFMDARKHRRSPYPLYDLIKNDIFKAPLALEATFIDDLGKSHAFRARVQPDGAVMFNYQLFETLKATANEALRWLKLDATAMHKIVEVQNGWDFWQFRDSDGTLLYTRILWERYNELMASHDRGEDNKRFR